MSSAGREDLPEQEIAPGYASRFADWGGITVAFEHATAGQDASAMVIERQYQGVKENHDRVRDLRNAAA